MRKKVLMMLCTVLMAIALFAGCGGEDRENRLRIFYLNMEGTGLVPESFEPESTETVELVNEMLIRLQSEPDSGDLRQTLSNSITVNGCLFNGNFLVVDFSSDYYNMSMTDEVLTRAAIVKTLLQAKDITSVSFTVESEPLLNAEKQEVGIMNSESFVENPGAQINSSVQTTLTLFFASSDGTYLKKETRSVHYSSNISLDKLVMEQLMEGPKSSGLQATIPSGTRLVTISTVDGVCYVNLDETFKNQNPEISESVVLYSIVNSLTQLPDVEKVQISINGDTSGKCRYDLDLSTMYEPSSDILKSKSDKDSDKDKTENSTQEPQSDPSVDNKNVEAPDAGVSQDIKVN